MYINRFVGTLTKHVRRKPDSVERRVAIESSFNWKMDGKTERAEILGPY